MVAAALPERAGGLDIVRLLVNRGADVFARDALGATAAHRAALPPGNPGKARWYLTVCSVPVRMPRFLHLRPRPSIF